MSRNLFGTDGIRSLVGKAPLTVEFLPKLGYAIAQWAAEKNKSNPSILLTHDTRSSSHFIKAALKSGLLLHNSTIFDALSLPTPTACLLVRMNQSFNCGIIITASHNPSEYNGIKIVDGNGSKISHADEKRIEDLYAQTNLAAVDHIHLGNDFRALNPGEPYIHLLMQEFDQDFLKGKTIVLDCANGATSSLAPHIFSNFGAHVIAINDKPDGVNINANCGSLFPKDLQEAVRAHNADAGFAFDGDGDRVIAVNRAGQIKDGDDILALLMDNPRHKNVAALVGTTFSNEGLASYVASKGKKFMRTDVGDQYVMEAMKLHKLPLGGEPSGHIIIQKHLDSADGIYTALSVLEAIDKNSNFQMTTFVHYPQVLVNMPVQQKKDLSQPPLVDILADSYKEFPSARTVVRYSGTEPLLRILVQAPEKNQAELQAAKLSNKLRTALES